MSDVQRNNRSPRTLVLAVAAFIAAGLSARPAEAVYWNNDSTFGTSSANGLTDKPIGFPNAHVIYNDSGNGSRGTAIMLNSEWALTVRHVVQNAGNYSVIANPKDISINVGGVGGYFVDQILVPDGSSEFALLHLRGGVNNTANLRPHINTGYDENGRIIQIGGYGLYGQVRTNTAGGTNPGTSFNNASFHRAYNTIGGFSGDKLQITQNAEAIIRNNNLLEGMAGSGDSGGPMFAFYGNDFATQQNDVNQWKLVGLTATSASAVQGNSSQYTRVANYAGFVNSRINSYAVPAARTTGNWVQDSGNNLNDTGRAKISVTGSTAAPPVVHAKFGPNDTGYTLGAVGDRIAMSATLDTPYAMDSRQFRFGLFDDANGTLAGNVNAGTPWNGYLAVNSSEGNAEGLYEKGANGGGTGAYWSAFGSGNTGTRLGTAAASGTYDDGAGTNAFAPAGSYSLSMTLTRLTGGLQIDWAMTQLTDALYALNPATGLYDHNATPGSYAFAGSVIDTNPASSTWTYDQLGFFLFGSTTADRTIVVDDINVGFTAVPEPAAMALIAGAIGLLMTRRRERRV